MPILLGLKELHIIQQLFNHEVKSYENHWALKKNLVYMLCE